MPVKTIEEILKETKIYQILRPKLVTAPPETTLENALALMQKEKAGYLVVADRQLKVVGMFTEREVLMKVLQKGVSLKETLDKYMNKNIRPLSKSDTVGMAIDVMKDYSVRHIPLVDEQGHMNGVLSIRTIVTFLSELFPTEVFNLPPKADQVHETAEGG
ncbi:MAG: CBS domain-containing protein [Candidatus Omnitrophica bacterium]|nr:CBS domain-containing protein [Candidatus Omnitrophota bacterium]